MPLLSWHNFIIDPKYSSGVITVALIQGSSMNFIVVGSRSHMSKETQKYFDKKKNEYDSVKVLAVGSSLKICLVA